MLESEDGIFPDSLSSPYSSSPVDMESTHMFTNCVGRIRTTLSPELLLAALHRLEKKCGRQRERETADVHADRVIDLDLLLYEGMIHTCDTLVLPHPGIAHRLFVLAPLAEIDPDLVHPVSQQKMKQLLQDRMKHNALLNSTKQETVTRLSWNSDTL